MPATRKKAIALLTTAAGLGIVLVAVIAFYPSLRERYWLSGLQADTEAEREEAAKALGKLGSCRAIVPLLTIVVNRFVGIPFVNGGSYFVRPPQPGDTLAQEVNKALSSIVISNVPEAVAVLEREFSDLQNSTPSHRHKLKLKVTRMYLDWATRSDISSDTVARLTSVRFSLPFDQIKF